MDTTDTGDPDEFSRLLAQLNGTASPEPAVIAPPVAPAAPVLPAAPVAPVMTPPPGPPVAAPAPVAPVFVAPDPVAAPVGPVAPLAPLAPLASGAPVAPAFGAAAPVPTLAPWSPPPPGASQPPAADPFAPEPFTPPSFVPEPVEAAPVPVVAAPVVADPVVPTPVVPVAAPELMGADELAAPPGAFSPPPPAVPDDIGEPEPLLPSLVAPPLGEPAIAPPPIGSPTPVAATSVAPAAVAPTAVAPVAAAPLAAAPLAAAPAPSAPAPSAPAPSAPAPSAPGALPAPAGASTGPRSPLDFSTLLSTSDDDDGVPRPASPLLLGSGGVDDEEPDIGKSTLAEKIGLILAVVVAPLGLIVGIVAAAGSARRRGWVIGLVRATVAIGAVLTVVLAIVGYFGYTQFKQQQLHDQTVAASTAFCSTLKANPTMDQLPTFGWPAVAASVPDSVKAMQAYEDRWTKLAKISPDGVKADVQKVASAAKGIIDSVNVSRTIDDASNIGIMSEVASSSGIPSWHSEYCP